MSLDKLSQNQRVLRAAWRYPRGICQIDFDAPDVIDGGKPIRRLAARIKDLSDDGIVFRDGGRRNNMKVYVLDRVSLADATKPPGPPPLCEQPAGAGASSSSGVEPAQQVHGGTGGTLFDLTVGEPPAVPRLAVHDDLDDVA